MVAFYHYQPDTVRALAQDHGIKHLYSDMDELLRNVPDLDAVVISTPTDTHHDLVLAAAAAGKHILCEKPIAYTVAQGQEMVAAVRSRNLVGKAGFIFRFSPVLQRMKELVDDGYIGELRLFESVGGNEQFIDPRTPQHWKMRPERAGGGVYVEYGVHHIDLAIWFGGPLTRVVAHGLTLVPERPSRAGGKVRVEVDDACSWIAAYQNGGEALFRTTWAALPLGGGGIRLYGTQGTLAQVYDPSGRSTEQLLGVTLKDREPQVLLDYAPPFDPAMDTGTFALGLLGRYNNRLVRSFIDDIHAGHVSSSTLEDALAAQRVLAAIRLSLDERRWVEIETD